jgi:hypothetical protein
VQNEGGFFRGGSKRKEKKRFHLKKRNKTYFLWNSGWAMGCRRLARSRAGLRGGQSHGDGRAFLMRRPNGRGMTHRGMPTTIPPGVGTIYARAGTGARLIGQRG